MPLIAIAGMIGADVVAGTAIAGVAAGTAIFTATTALEVVAAVGATVAAIGAVTGNKALTLAGGVIGIIGGVGALASSAGLLGAAANSAPLFGAAPAASVADAAADGGGFAEGLTTATAGTADGPIDAGTFGYNGATAGTGAVDGAASTADAASSGTIPFIAGGDGTGAETPTDLTTLNTISGSQPDPMTMANQTPNSTLNNALTAEAVTTPTPAASVPPPAATAATTGPGYAASGGSANPLDYTQLTGAPAGTGAAAPASSSSSISDAFSGLLGFADKHPVATLGVLQAGGSLLTGLTSTLTPAQVSALNAQAASNNAAAGLQAQQTANLAMPKAVASSTPVTGPTQQIVSGAGTSPAPTGPASGAPGLINSALASPNLLPVTGVPA